MQDEYKEFRRHLPHFHSRGATYFITFRTRGSVLNSHEQDIVLENLKQGDGKYYTLVAATIMPGHVHVVIRPNEGVNLSRITKSVKGSTARLINKRRNRLGRFWQDESYDRIIRSDDELIDTLNYILSNSVKARLCDDPWTYRWWYLKGLDR